jgi:hypothetical protein
MWVNIRRYSFVIIIVLVQNRDFVFVYLFNESGCTSIGPQFHYHFICRKSDRGDDGHA